METLPPSTDVVISVEESEKILKLIRRDWKWAAASDFLYKFNPMLHLDYLDLAVSLSHQQFIFGIIFAFQRVHCASPVASFSRLLVFDSRFAYSGRRARSHPRNVRDNHVCAS